jgi:hypothetical protein
VNVASAKLPSTPLSVLSRTLVPGGVPFPSGASSDLSAFLSLMTDVLEKTPAVRPGPIEPPPSYPMDAAGAAVTSKDKSQESSSNLSKDTKNHKKEESPALPSLPEPVPFLTKPPAALEFPALGPGLKRGNEQVTSDENLNGGPVQRTDIAPVVLAPALTALTPAAGGLAFALRLTPSGSETMNTENAVAWSWPPSPQQSAEDIVSAALQESPMTSGPQRKSGPQLTFEPQSKPDAGGVAAASPADTSVRPPDPAAKTDGAPELPRGLPGRNPAGESGMPQPKPNVAKVEPAAKPELQEFRLNDSHVEASGKGLTGPAWPSDAGGAPDTRGAPDTGAGSGPAGDPTALKAASEPEIKIGLVPPITRQISLNLSADDSTQVNIGFTERAGKVLVAVRTTDRELTQSLQTNLGDLVGRLESKGFKTETWMPSFAHQEAAPLQSSNSNTGFNQPHHSGPGNGGGQQRQGQNNSTQRQKERWAAQLVETISANEARSES